jgi:hypothetical protein
MEEDYREFFSRIQDEGTELEVVPDSFYYYAYGAQLGRKTSEFNYFGGAPMVDEDFRWPSCDVHGPLPFLWQCEDPKKPGDLLQFFCCVEILDKQGKIESIRPHYSCENDLYAEPKTHGVHICNGIGYVARKTRISTDLSFGISPIEQLIAKTYFSWGRVKLCDEKAIRALPQKFDWYEFEGGYLHSDVVYEAERDSVHTAEEFPILMRTRGIGEQHTISETFGYIVMPWSVDGPFPFHVYKNVVHLGLSYDLVMMYCN